MRVKVAVGVLLALLIGSCPCLAPLAAARPGGSDAHSCCSGPDRDGPDTGTVPADGGMACCLRALPSSAVLPSFDPQVVGEPASIGPAAFVRQRRSRPAATPPSPPGDPPSSPAASPRAPPVPA